MALPLDFLIFDAILVLTLTLILVNFVVYLGRGRRSLGMYTLGAFLLGLIVIGSVVGGAVLGLGDQYGTATILSRWGFTFGWAFLLALAAAGATVFDRRPEGKISITLNIVAMLLVGFGLAGSLIVGPEAPAFPTSLVSLGLAALFTSVFRWIFEHRRKKKGFLERVAELLRIRKKKRGFFERLSDRFRG